MPLRLTFGEFEIDEARFELRRRAEPVHLQPRVMDLVLYLAKNRHRVVTKEELLATVWQGIAVTEGSLTQAVSLARRVLGDSPIDQDFIRTVRNRGFQFVATCKEPGAKRELRPTTAADRRASTAAETEEDTPKRPANGASRAAHLYGLLDCEAPHRALGSWSLDGVDEVHFVRASERRAHRHLDGTTRVLTIAIPGRYLSRRHARLVRIPGPASAGPAEGLWVIVDGGSRNGTLVNGERVDKRGLAAGDIVECGRVFFMLTDEPVVSGIASDLQVDADAVIPTVSPGLTLLNRDIERLATTEMSMLLLGESGVGKTHAAGAIHRVSGRAGPLVVLDPQDAHGAVARARDGTLVVENVERTVGPALEAVSAAVSAQSGVRVVTTTTVSISELQARLPTDVLTRLGGFRCTIPPLRERRGDFGVFFASLLRADDRTPVAIDPAAARVLVSWAYGGNAYELAHAVDVARALSKGGPIEVGHLPIEMRAR